MSLTNPERFGRTLWVFVAAGAAHEQNLFFDGVNEAGLSATLFWLNEARYMPRQGNEAVSTFDLVAYIRGQYGWATEAKAALSHLTVYGTYPPEYDVVLPIHLMVTDASGDSFIVEWVDGRMNIYDQNTPGFIAWWRMRHPMMNNSAISRPMAS